MTTVLRQTLRAMLDAQPALKVVGEAEDGIEAIHFAQQIRPDVILMDAYMPRMDGIESTRHIQALVPETCIIGMSSDSRAWVEEAFLIGRRARLSPQGTRSGEAIGYDSPGVLPLGCHR